MSLETVTLQTARDFLEGTRTSLSTDISTGIGEALIWIIGLAIAIGLGVGFIIFMKSISVKFSFPEGRRVGRRRFVGFDGTEFWANVSEVDTFKKNDLKELSELGYVKTAPEVLDILESKHGFKVYNAKIFKYGQGVSWRASQKTIQIHTRVSLEDVDYFTTAQKSTRSWNSILEPETTQIIYYHKSSEIEKIKTYDGKPRDVFCMAVMPTNERKHYAEYSNIFKDKHTTIITEVNTIGAELSEKLGQLIEWTPKVAYLEKELNAKTSTLKDFDNLLDEKSKKLSKFNIVINLLRGALEQKKLTGTDQKREPLKIASNVMMAIFATFVGGMAFSGWMEVEQLNDYTPWFGVIIASIVMGVLVHASEQKKKDDYEKQNLEVENT